MDAKKEMQPGVSVIDALCGQASELPSFKAFNVEGFKSQVTHILDQVGHYGMFEEYTRHDVSHAHEMMRIYEWLVPEATQKCLTPADAILIMVASYLHDLGLIVTRNEFANRDSTGFRSYVNDVVNGEDSESKDFLSKLGDISSDAAQRFLYQEYVRANHASRIKNWIRASPDYSLGGDAAVVSEIWKLVQDLEPVFLKDLANVCESHHLEDLHDNHKYPLIRPYGNSPEEIANVQYAAILLRIGDLLHITKDRTPSICFRIVSPSNPRSQREWAKQMAVRSVRPQEARDRDGVVDPSLPRNTVEVHALFDSEDGFFGLTQYLAYAEAQLQQCHSWSVHSNKEGASKYLFPWRYIDTSGVEAEGFIAQQFNFSIDQHKILELLTGHTLYNNADVVVREIVQNSLDAVRLQEFNELPGDYTPSVQVRWTPDERILEVIDNGTGMSQTIIQDHFLKVGSSRYQAPAFAKEHPEFNSISRFGIGVLSTFMISDEVEVLTCSSEDAEARQIALRGVHGQYLVKLLPKDDSSFPDLIKASGHGTRVRITLRSSAELQDVDDLLKTWVVIPRAQVTYIGSGDLKMPIGFDSIDAALREAILEDDVAVEGADGRLQDHRGTELEIRKFQKGNMEIAYLVRWNSYFKEWSFVSLPDDNRAARRFYFSETAQPLSLVSTRGASLTSRTGVSVEGVRVEAGSPGYGRGGLVAMANLTGKDSPRTNVARTSLEASPELENYYDFVYAAYAGHLSAEISRICEMPDSSLTTAAHEATFLAGALLPGESSMSSTRIFRRRIREVKAVLVELNDSRTLMSFTDIQEFKNFFTLYSASIRRVESFLGAVGGNASLASALRLGGEVPTSSLPLPDTKEPLVCSTEGIFWHNVASAHEPEYFALVDGRHLQLRWRGTGGDLPVWGAFGANTSDVVAPLWRLIMSEQSNLSGRFNYVNAPRPGSIVTTSGLDQFDIIYAHGLAYLLPSSPVNQVVVSSDAPIESRLVASLLASLLVSHAGRPERSVEASFRFAFQTAPQRLGWGNLLDDEQLLEWRNYKVKTMDPMRWDRERNAEP